MKKSEKGLHFLLDVYDYQNAFKMASLMDDFSSDCLYILEMLKERRELNIDFLYKHHDKNQSIKQNYGLNLVSHSKIEETILNYILDLEAKIKNGRIIDFVRSVSPILYRLFIRVLLKEIPDLFDYVENSRSDRYDTWRFEKMKTSSNQTIQAFISRRRDSRVTSRSLVDLILVSNTPDEIKETVELLRQFEKSVRNPLSHLIRAFDEKELHRTTGFSSKLFLEKIIDLAEYTGLEYNRKKFYFDQMNHFIKKKWLT
ncbi:LytR family transcriptional regulator [Streptococcus sp. CSL10205-OR2]|uniref:LytR family transcriptional regulator n=1 Tax=Streptococcus sp. CSL10205-OR2 TaxID=2980558 RepID=UPI0021DA0E94|nr:LytR family transcriptional regulator [Streptococcus sp. CSL10205-OR2]MCU9533598.1 LytR family transcriptional regulator [Streptococcus sp. CSL10205-OR2]